MASVSSIPAQQLAQTQQNASAMDKVPQDKMYLPGAYAIPRDVLEIPKPEKKSSFLGLVTKAFVALALVGASAILVRKSFMRNTDSANIFVKYTDKLIDGLKYCKDKAFGLFERNKE